MLSTKTINMENLITSVFPEKKENEYNIFVIMPYGANKEYGRGTDEADYVYKEIISAGIRRAEKDMNVKFNIHREVDKVMTGSITKNIIRSLAAADIVIGDLTGKNPNVFLELGIRFSLREKGTLLLTQNPEDVPFDITNYRYIRYTPFTKEYAIDRISKYLEKVINEEHLTDSIVFDFIPEIFVSIPGVSEVQSGGKQNLRTITWKEINERSEKLADIVGRPIKDGNFTPDAIIGISNGGYIIAEIIGRRLFHSKPILGLWANRDGDHNLKYRFFENDYNDGLCEVLMKKTKDLNEPLKIILLDDHIGWGNTSGQAINYLKEKLGKHTLILFIPIISGRPEEVFDSLEEYLPYGFTINKKKVFNITKEEFIKIVKTDAKNFPYLDKEIRQGV